MTTDQSLYAKQRMSLQIFCVFAWCLLGCARPTSSAIDIIGSTTVTPLMEHLVKAYMQEHDVRFQIQSLGSTTGINSVRDGQTPIGMSSRALTEQEEQSGVIAYHFATEALAVAVNINNPISNLTIEQIQGIFSGKITNWQEVGGINRPIVVVSREAGSGARSTFESLVGLQQNRESLVDDAPILIIGDGTGQVRANVASRLEGIGYMSLNVVDGVNIKYVNINGIEPTYSNIEKGYYLLQEPLYLLLRADSAPEARAFLEWVLSPAGQLQVIGFGAVPVGSLDEVSDG